MSKNVTVLIKSLSLNSSIASNALRMGVGLTLAENEITYIFMENGIFCLRDFNHTAINMAEVNKHIDAMISMGCKLIIEKESLERLQNQYSSMNFKNIHKDVNILSAEKITGIIINSDVVISY